MRTLLPACIAILAALIVAAPLHSAGAQQVPPPIVLGPPVDCKIPEVCWVQNYFDHDPGPGSEDYTCGKLAYDRHRGTDIRVANLAVMGEGIPVIASADGVVAAIRDGMPDTGIVDATPESIRGRECGNGVSLRHADGWITQYCHLKSGSVEVVKGQQVKKGDKLALMGLSGMTEFPHVHLEVKHAKRSVDPFVGYEATGKCGTAAKPLFEAAFLEKSPYVETGLLNAGFTNKPPKGVEILRGEHVFERLPVDAPALVYWVELYGTQPGDRAQFTITGPDGSVLVQQTHDAQPGYSARRLAFSGRRRPANGWAEETYTGTFRLLRDQVGETKVAFELAKSIPVGSPARNTATTPPASTPQGPSAAEPEPVQTAARETTEVQQAATTPTTPATEGDDESPASVQRRDVADPPVAARPLESTSDGQVAAIVERAAELLPVDRLPAMMRRRDDDKGPPPWIVAIGLLGVIFGMAGVAYITRR